MYTVYTLIYYIYIYNYTYIIERRCIYIHTLRSILFFSLPDEYRFVAHSRPEGFRFAVLVFRTRTENKKKTHEYLICKIMPRRIREN